MMEYFELKETLILTLFSLVALQISSSPLFPSLSFFFLFLGVNGVKNTLNYELNRIYHRRKFKGDFHEAYKLAFLFLLIALIMAYYFGYGHYFLLSAVAYFLSSLIKARASFFSDFLYFLASIFTFSIPFQLSPSPFEIPFLWSLSLILFLRRIIWDIIRPFGVENFNLPKMLGLKGARNVFYLLSLLTLLWLTMPAAVGHTAYSALYAIPFSFIITSSYLVRTDRAKEAEKVLDYALLSYLFTSIFL